MPAPMMPQRRLAISWHLRSWPMNAVRRDLGLGGRPSPSSSSDSKSGFDQAAHLLLPARPHRTPLSFGPCGLLEEVGGGEGATPGPPGLPNLFLRLDATA